MLGISGTLTPCANGDIYYPLLKAGQPHVVLSDAQVLREGAIVQAGKYNELLQTGTDLSTLVNAHKDALDTMEVQSDKFDEDSGNLLASIEFQNNLEDEKEKVVQQDSRSNTHSAKIEKIESFRQLVKEEERERGLVSSRVYWSYLTAIAHGSFIPLVLIAQIMFAALQILGNYWMVWATPATEGGSPKVHDKTLVLVYSALALASSFFILVRAATSSLLGLVTAQKIFLDMVRCIFRAPMAFFDSTPTGRILNRARPFSLSSLSSTFLNLHL